VTAQAQLQHYHLEKLVQAEPTKAFQKLGGIEEEWLVVKYLIIRTYKIQIIYFDLTYPMAPNS
jgi:hypothetical protein